MKNAAFTIRFNNEIEADRNLLYMLKSDSKGYRSTSECIKNRLFEYYNSNKNNDSFEELIQKSQKELIEQMYDICLKIISSVAGLNINNTAIVDANKSILPEATNSFPDELIDVLDLLAT